MDIEYIFWRFNLTHSVLRYSNESKNPLKVYQEYENRVDLNPKTYTLVLKNLQETDNGIYSAKITDHRGYEKDVAKHELHVHEAVPDLEFTMLLIYFNSTEGYCNVSVTCAAGDSSVAYTCDPGGCTQDLAVLVTPQLLLGVTGAGGTVVCNGSNLVSARSRWGRMSDVCTEELVSSPMSLLGPTVILVDILTALLLIYLLLYCLVIRPKHTGVFTTTKKMKMKCASIELLHVNEFEEVLKDPSLPDYLRGAAIYSISRGRKPPLPRLGHPIPDHTDTYTLARL
ncbi:uncharacterized protein LOC124472796 isoform X2 [Hypomesus transpacificus]|nr:uncharacterized protein LOC124472796 isoform X2 [Hypomesus transpacificus]